MIPFILAGGLGVVGVNEVLHHVFRVLDHFILRAFVMVGYAHEKLWPRNDSLPLVLGREISAAPEGFSVGKAEHVERPTCRLVEHLNRLDVNVIYVRSFLAIDFHANEMVVHDVRHVGILERFVSHDVTPVAGGVTDGH